MLSARDISEKRIFWLADAGGEGRQGYQPFERGPFATTATHAVYGDPLARAWRALDGDYCDLLPVDGVSIQVERCTTKGYGNAIVPQAAAAFLEAYQETLSFRLTEMSVLTTDSAERQDIFA
jgi:hypothetical protein